MDGARMEEAVKRLAWSASQLQRRPAELSPHEPLAIVPPVSVHGQQSHFTRDVAEEVTPSPPRSYLSGLAESDSNKPTPPSLGRSASILTAAATLLDASRERPDDGPRRQLKSSEKVRRRAKAKLKANTQHRAAHVLLGGIRLRALSRATPTQLSLLAGAFHRLPNPSKSQLLKMSRFTGVAPGELELWFESRRTLEAWVQQQPNLQAADVARLFYSEAIAEPEGEAASSERDLAVAGQEERSLIFFFL